MTPHDLLELARAAKKAGRVDHPVAGPLGFATPEYWRFIQSCTPARIVALVGLLRDTEATLVARERAAGLHRGPTFKHAMTTPLDAQPEPPR